MKILLSKNFQAGVGVIIIIIITVGDAHGVMAMVDHMVAIMEDTVDMVGARNRENEIKKTIKNPSHLISLII